MSEKKSVIKQIYDTLSERFETYFPAQHEGECKSRYVVVKHGGNYELLTISSERPIYVIMCYVPERNYTQLEDFKNEVKEQMKNVYPLVSYIGNETESYYDTDKKAHMISFQYQGIRKIKNWNW